MSKKKMMNEYITLKDGFGFRDITKLFENRFGSKHNHATIRKMILNAFNKVTEHISVSMELSEEEKSKLARSQEFHSFLMDTVRSMNLSRDMIQNISKDNEQEQSHA